MTSHYAEIGAWKWPLCADNNIVFLLPHQIQHLGLGCFCDTDTCFFWVWWVVTVTIRGLREPGINQLTLWAYCEIPGHIGARTEKGKRRRERIVLLSASKRSLKNLVCSLVPFVTFRGATGTRPQVLLAWEKRFYWIQRGVHVIFSLKEQAEVKRTQSETFNLRPVTVKGGGRWDHWPIRVYNNNCI